MKIAKRSRNMLIVFVAIFVTLYTYSTFTKEPVIDATAAILMDAQSGKVVYGKNENMPLAPASMSKMMTEYIVLEKIHNGTLKWSDPVRIGPNAVNSIGAKINVRVGNRLTVRDLFHAMVISSANNAAVALAEHISKSEENFTKLMNAKAKQLNLSNETHFVNATGLPNAQHQESKMTAFDVATLAQHLLQTYPEVLDITKLTNYTLSYNGATIMTTNKMLDTSNDELYFQGIDGLKTGFTDEAGYCFTGTAKQGENRLISVVMGTSEDTKRFIETKKLFSYGFNKISSTFLNW
ncbi:MULTISPECIES: D-alanyl-D-alanine carboxypeptidase family protein [Bacillus]|uniref:D-alanyl-D-alanine carboxypeptidase n=1 Tax=Bacillus cereus TaxID=1396 RepID=A0A2A8J7F2_BACCE|nr:MULTISPECIES: D-alanyl-D-alanine carboxypeptidase family protein [Bacillus]MDH4421452.1 D-alanyl-D-alanine carboxypeptidase [Bacillus cereus]PER28329.1 D-alanyl-D-alanine carboxypeptidase [Bacillus cereus]PFA59570.1 D-alanyl-D-alanine carboxypeptidase [Bacillus sp. AFS015896]PGL87010.1 D-alanyl-D-alanine carboxypeptidase [Bacillus sp. AFS054943]PGT99907.1 D-alanyl-D-alanine carboxypeptidase [Bacillus cereus]